MIAEVWHFTYGWVTPGLAYLASFVGAFVGLLAIVRARLSEGGQRLMWLALGATTIGCTGIWAMHFIAMLGFSVPGMMVRYDVPLTVLSAAIPIVVVALGLAIATVWHGRLWSLPFAGIVTGLGVASMHYVGMASMSMHGAMHHDRVFVAVAIVIAIVASTAALWAALYVRGRRSSFVAALVMGLAVCAMHYTAMAGVEVHVPGGEVGHSVPPGASVTDFVLPLLLGVGLPTLLLGQVLLLTENDEPEQGETGREPHDPSGDEPASSHPKV